MSNSKEKKFQTLDNLDWTENVINIDDMEYKGLFPPLFENDNSVPLNLKQNLEDKAATSASGCKKRKLYRPRQRSAVKTKQNNGDYAINNNKKLELLEVFAKELKEKIIGSVMHIFENELKKFKESYFDNKFEEKVLNFVNEKEPTNYKCDENVSRYGCLDFINHSTSVAIPNPCLNQGRIFSSIFDEDSSLEHFQDNMNAKVIPFARETGNEKCVHKSYLRKAKLMFFWVRYPSSAVLKMYFPDIKFNKNNTAQLVKWFSNFREFYYKNIENYARKLISESNEQCKFEKDSELYKIFQLHYNCNNIIEMPLGFYRVVDQTLLEFINAIQTGKDSLQSWKKAIYKVIAKLDEPVPDYYMIKRF